MPHDRNGKELKAGDEVKVTCKVIGVGQGDDHCNLDLQTVEPCHPGTEPTAITLNSRQVEKTQHPATAVPPKEPTPSKKPAAAATPKKDDEDGGKGHAGAGGIR